MTSSTDWAYVSHLEGVTTVERIVVSNLQRERDGVTVYPSSFLLL